ncbi:MAG: hypothetical protein PGN37_16640 [Mycobacterium kyogaense]|uniref:hypothetical protein n=1 Tax=Mycobacterium kyogaense TaxID=2212479 RepID=UPI002FF85FD7
MESALTLVGIATGLATLLAAVVSLPFTPARFWSWRLRKHAETVNVIDPERQPHQHEIVMRHADLLASKVAAAHHIPTDWNRFKWTMISIGFPVGVALSSVWMVVRGQKPWDGLTPLDIYGFVFATMWWFATVLLLIASYKQTRMQRLRFIELGCPPDYEPPTNWSEARIADFPSHLRSVNHTWRRARDMRKAGSIPAEWRPRNEAAALRRKVSVWARDRPWYLGGMLR